MVARTVMKPLKSDTIPLSDRFLYEAKYDGGSAIITINSGVYIAHNNNADNQLYKYPELNVLSKLPHGEYIAELCVITPENVAGIINTFQKRQCSNYYLITQRTKTYPITAVVYDITKHGEDDTTRLDLLERKKLLKKLVKPMPNVALADYYTTPEELLKFKDNIEGIVIKNIDAPYRFDRRDGWYKYRFNKEETVKFIGYEEWSNDNNQGVILSTEEGFRVNLAGKRCLIAIQQIQDKGYVNCEVSYYSKSKDGFRFAVIKRVLT